MSAVSGHAADASIVAAPPSVDIAEVVPRARHIYPVELAPSDLLFDTSGALQPIGERTVLHDGRVVSTLLTNGHRVWLWNDEPIIAVLPRVIAPSITVYERVFDPEDEAGWVNGDPRVIESETETLRWEPDDGNLIGIPNSNGTLDPSSSPPFTEGIWYSGRGVDFARGGATLDTSAHPAGFTLAELEQIGARVTRRRDSPRRRGTRCAASLLTSPGRVPAR